MDWALRPHLVFRCYLVRLEGGVTTSAHIEQAPRFLYRLWTLNLVEGVLCYFSQTGGHAAVSAGYGLHRLPPWYGMAGNGGPHIGALVRSERVGDGAG